MDAEEMVKGVLEANFGMEVEKIPETGSKTPDFIASLNGETYLFEVKHKQSNPELAQGREAALSDGQLYEIAQKIVPTTVLRNIVGSGIKQLKAFNEAPDSYRIVWIHCDGIAYDAVAEQVFCGLYGADTVVDWSEKNKPRNGDCYYLRHSHFHKYRNDIDAVVISRRNGECRLCLNDHSPRYKQLKYTDFVTTFENGVCDPPKEDEEGTAFLVNGPVDRSDEAAVLDYLKGKYDSDRLTIMTMNHIEAHVAVPHEE